MVFTFNGGEMDSASAHALLFLHSLRFEEGGRSDPSAADFGGIHFEIPLVQNVSLNGNGGDGLKQEGSKAPQRNQWQKQLDALVDLFE